MTGITIEAFNLFQLEMRELHKKHNMPFGTIHLKLMEGEYPIAEPIHLISETVLEGAGGGSGKRNEKT